MTHDVNVLVIGAGMSGIGLAIQLIRQHKTRSFELIEKSESVAGTWWVPSHFYSYSLELNPNWSQKFALQPEIYRYFTDVADKYDIPKHVRFRQVVESARWDTPSGTWIVTIGDLESSQIRQRRCKVLVSAVAALSIPKKCDIPGASTFQGRMFHTAEWDYSFDWKGRDVVVIGNGCSATQVVPAISEGDEAAKKVTQFSRQSHWLAERQNPKYSNLFKWAMQWVPFAMRASRAMLYWEKEKGFQGFYTASGAEIRRGWSEEAAVYIRANSPATYRDFLVPKTEIGCKRRVNDTGYLASLHRANVALIYDDPITEITKDGIYGKDGVSINEHWDIVSDGSPSSYFGTCLSGFPNFFIMMGPNTLSGHLSVIYTTECQINFAMRAIAPILKALHSRRSLLPAIGKLTDVMEITPEAEMRDINETQDKAKGLTNRNTIMFPDWQYKFWLRSVFASWNDLRYTTSTAATKEEQGGRLGLGLLATVLAAGLVAVGAYLFN
ncbi:FAD-binding monooxygenase ktnD [Colletotrichum viniferum]|nr:FAD-binding monooxygenase ktnD [Colletotrichum viniferum]